MIGRSYGSLGLHLGKDARFECFTYTDVGPILTLHVGDLSVSVTPDGRKKIMPGDVEKARELLDAVGVYLAECERLASLSANVEAEAA